MATFVILPEAVRGSMAFGHAGDASPTPLSIPAGAPKLVDFRFPSSDWAAPGHTMDVSFELSKDNGNTWVGFGGFSGVSGMTGRNGLAQTPELRPSWDGEACLVRGSVVVNAPFSWGLTIIT